MFKPWVAVDLDGTIAHYDGWKGADHIGEPIQPMLERVKKWLKEGTTVKIFTARVSDPDPMAIPAIKEWCRKHIGQELEVTNVKDFGMVECWDDRAVQVVKNTGERVDGK